MSKSRVGRLCLCITAASGSAGGGFGVLGLVSLAVLGGPVRSLAQSFVDGAAQIPQGNPLNNSSTENVDFADIDLDGDYDAVFADGGNDGNDRNGLWVNQGGLQEGTAGTFADETDARFPNAVDQSRDVDFVDIDLDGDEDLHVSNTSLLAFQPSRWHVNQGGLQGGTAGFFIDETSTRWVNVGQNDGVTTFSSVAASLALSGGGFIDWSGDSVFGDLDDDGDMDLVHTSYGPTAGPFFGGKVPSRLFLNDGAGFYEEFNPSSFQLSGTNIDDGDPALWAEGIHVHDTQMFNGTEADIAATTLGAELGDVDGDFDLELLIGARYEQPRIFLNRLEENDGVLARFRDVTYGVLTSFGSGNYEQELGDMDNDNDLDIYGANWGNLYDDVSMPNDGIGNFAAWTVISGTGSDDNEGDWFDYNNDGYLDLFIANFSGQDRLHENDGPPGYGLINVTGTEVPSESLPGLGLDSVDVDNDGDFDLMVCNDNFGANRLLINITQTADTNAPRVIVEQAPNQTTTSDETPIRANVFDNTSWDVNRYNVSVLEYTANGGPVQTVPMVYAGGQLFRGVIPAGTVGTIAYRAKSTDQSGNTGSSATLVYTVAGGTLVYCTAGTSAAGCQASLTTTGTPSASAPSGFSFVAAGVEGAKDGLFFFGTNGQQANSWGNGTSYQCVVPPVVRTPTMSGVGTIGLCDGSFALDLNALWCPTCPSLAKNPGPGATIQAQLWYRDPLSTSNQTTSLSDAIEFLVAP